MRHLLHMPLVPWKILQSFFFPPKQFSNVSSLFLSMLQELVLTCSQHQLHSQPFFCLGLLVLVDMVEPFMQILSEVMEFQVLKGLYKNVKIIIKLRCRPWLMKLCLWSCQGANLATIWTASLGHPRAGQACSGTLRRIARSAQWAVCRRWCQALGQE